MKKFTLVLMLLFTVITISSCRSKKKLTENEKTKTELEAKINKDSISEKVEKVDSSTVTTKEQVSTKKTEEVTLEENETYEIEADEEGGPITIEEEETEDGNKKVTITGASNVKISNETTSSTIKTEEEVRILEEKVETFTRQLTEMTKLKEEVELKLEEEKKKRNTDVETTGIPFMSYVWTILIIIILIVLYVLYRRFRGYIGGG